MNPAIRRMEINLLTLGTGIIIFGVWSFVRAALTIFVFDNDIATQVTEDIKVITYVLLVVATVLGFLGQLFIGLSARTEAKGKKKKSGFYLVLCCIGVILSFLIIVAEISTLISQAGTGFVSILAAIIVDATAVVCSIELMINSMRLRRVRKNNPDWKNGVTL